MKAWVLHEVGDIKFEEVNVPRIKQNEVLLEVKAAGICGSDIPRIYETGAHNMPIIPGHEFSGKVVEIGSNVDPKWNGKRVGVFPLIPCGKCNLCKKKLYEMCVNYNYLGSRCNGGFAEYVAVPEKNLIELRENITYEQAAMLEPMSVAVHAIRRAMPQKNDIVVVHGLGTIGTLITIFLLDLGIHDVLVIGNKNKQKEVLEKYGINNNSFCNCRNELVGKYIKEKTGLGADVYFDCVGRNETISDAIDNTAPTGKVILVGNPYSDLNLDKNIYWKILRNQIFVTGTWNSSFVHDPVDDWNYVLSRIENDGIMPQNIISHRLKLSELSTGIKIMHDKREDYLKIILKKE